MSDAPVLSEGEREKPSPSSNETENDLIRNWHKVEQVCRASFRSSFHFSIAVVDREGRPHVTPIGSLLLVAPGQAVYFEEFTQRLPEIFEHNPQVCVLAVNSDRWYWLKALLRGKFATPPALRLYGVAGARRPATEMEMARWQRRVRQVKFTKGHQLLWRDMRTVREIRFTEVRPVRIGRMTEGLW